MSTFIEEERPVKIRIIAVDNDDAFRCAFMKNLVRQGLDVKGVPDNAALYRELLEHSADIVILDAAATDSDSFVAAKHLRAMQRTYRLGIIMLAPDHDVQMCIHALQCGADMFLTKKTDHREIHANILSLHRRLLIDSPSPARAPWRFSRSEWKLFAPSGAEILLTHLETLLIDILADHRGKAVPRKDIISTALHQNPLAYDPRRLEAVVGRLRRKIVKIYGSSQPIRAAHSVGYMFADSIVRA